MNGNEAAKAPPHGSSDWRPILLRRWWPQVRGFAPLLLRSRPVTATGFILLFLALQFLIPARLVIGGMGAVGRPSVAMGALFAFLWFLSALRPRGLPAGRQPVRWLIGGFLVVQLIGYAIGMDRMPGPAEASAGDRYLILMLAMAGVALLLADGIPRRGHFDLVLRGLVGLTATMATVGVLQYLRIVDLTRYIRIPGLTANRELFGVGTRGTGELARVAGTANHYIEFGVVLSLVLPLALHFALFAPPGRRLWRWLQVGLIGGAIPMSISRSAILTTAVAMVFLFMVWKWRLRYNALVVGAIAVTAFHFLTRGLFGTILALFRHVDNDPSIQSRLSDQALVYELWSQRPIFGRGAGMILPERYLLFDNEIFVTLIGGGIVGLVALTCLFLVPYLMARSVRLRATSEEDRHLGQALAASFPAAFVAAGTFDALSFATYTGLLFTLVGVTGALWRLQGPRPERVLAWSPEDRFVAPPLFAADHPRWNSWLLATPERKAVDTQPDDLSSARRLLVGTHQGGDTR